MIIFINGKIGGGSPPAGAEYWTDKESKFVPHAQEFFKDNNIYFTKEDYKWLSSAKTRRADGYEYAKAHFQGWAATMKDGETFKLISHSMGGAFAMGFEDYIKEQGKSVEYNIMINVYQIHKISIPETSDTIYIDYKNTNDPVLFFFDRKFGRKKLQNSNYCIREKSKVGFLDIHLGPITTCAFWETFEKILNQPVTDK